MKKNYSRNPYSYNPDYVGNEYYYNYNNKNVKKLNIRNRALAIMLAGAIGFGVYCLVHKDDRVPEPVINNNYIESVLDNMDPNHEVRNGGVVTPVPTAVPTPVPTAVPTPVPTQEPITVQTNSGDSIIATSDVNMRLSPDKKSFKLGTLNAGSVVDRLYRDGDWDLVRVGSELCYVNSKYTRTYEQDWNNEYYDIEDYRDLVETTTKLNFRSGPSSDEQKIDLLDNGEMLQVIGKSINRNDPNDIWYLVKARGKIGFVSAAYTRSLRSEVLALDPDLREIDIDAVARIKRDTTLYNANGNSIKTIDKYQHVHVIEQYSNYTLVEHDGKFGMVSNDDLAILKGHAYVMDYSRQATFYYCNGELAHVGRCTTGADNSPTDEGYTDSNDKQRDYHDFGHDGYFSDIIFWHLWGNQFIHDAGWEPDQKFGDTKYYHRHGSGGCVRVPDEEAWFVQNNIPEDAARLGHK